MAYKLYTQMHGRDLSFRVYGVEKADRAEMCRKMLHAARGMKGLGKGLSAKFSFLPDGSMVGRYRVRATGRSIAADEKWAEHIKSKIHGCKHTHLQKKIDAPSGKKIPPITDYRFRLDESDRPIPIDFDPGPETLPGVI